MSTEYASNITLFRLHSSSTPFAAHLNSTGVQEFQIQNISIDISGLYECKATNMFGSGNDSTEVVVLCKLL